MFPCGLIFLSKWSLCSLSSSEYREMCTTRKIMRSRNFSCASGLELNIALFGWFRSHILQPMCLCTYLQSVLNKQPSVSDGKYENWRRDIWSYTQRLCLHCALCKLITTINWDLAIFLDSKPPSTPFVCGHTDIQSPRDGSFWTYRSSMKGDSSEHVQAGLELFVASSVVARVTQLQNV